MFLLALFVALAAAQNLHGSADNSRMLAIHNTLRKGVKPSAMDMEVMTWDNSLATASLNWAKKCLWKHDTSNNANGWGENLALSSNYVAGGTATSLSSVESWYNEVQYWNSNTCKCKSGEVCGHYTQVVWAKSNKLGCAAVKCTNINVDGKIWKTGYMTVCKYKPAGNYGGCPYQAGPSCAQCPLNCHGGCKGKLCQQGFTRCEDKLGGGSVGLNGKQYTCVQAKAAGLCSSWATTFLKTWCERTCGHCTGHTASSGKAVLDATCSGTPTTTKKATTTTKKATTTTKKATTTTKKATTTTKKACTKRICKNVRCGTSRVRCGNTRYRCGSTSYRCGNQQYRCGNRRIRCGTNRVRCGNRRWRCGNRRYRCGNRNVRCGIRRRCNRARFCWRAKYCSRPKFCPSARMCNRARFCSKVKMCTKAKFCSKPKFCDRAKMCRRCSTKPCPIADHIDDEDDEDVVPVDTDDDMDMASDSTDYDEQSAPADEAQDQDEGIDFVETRIL